MIEAGVTVGRLRALLFDEADQLGVGAERSDAVLAGETRSPTVRCQYSSERSRSETDSSTAPMCVSGAISTTRSTIAPSPLAVLEGGLLHLRLRESERTTAYLRVQLVLDRVDLRGSRVGLGPQVARIGRVAAELE